MHRRKDRRRENRRAGPRRATRGGLLGLVCAVAGLTVACGGSDPVDPEPDEPVPPLGPTIFIDPDIITPSVPTTLVSVEEGGTGERHMPDRRVGGVVAYEARLFNATFDDGLSAEIQVNPEFDAAEALAAAEKYGEVIGRLPRVLREDVAVVQIHRGVELLGGGEGNLLIHTGQAELYEDDGILEEALAHQAAHTSLDAVHAASDAWVDAQTEDGNFISQFAKDNPTTEDVAESIVPYIAVRYSREGITDFLAGLIVNAISARIAYFDAQGFDMDPIN